MTHTSLTLSLVVLMVKQKKVFYVFKAEKKLFYLFKKKIISSKTAMKSYFFYLKIFVKF